MQLFSPASASEAIDLIQTHEPTFDTPGQRALFSQRSLTALFDKGQRSPEHVWAVRDETPERSGVLAGRLIGDLALIDVLALPADGEAAALLIDGATAWARTVAEAEVSFESPVTDEPLMDPAVARVVAALGHAGWLVLVTRRHYSVGADQVAAASAEVPLPCTLDRARPDDRDRLVALVARVLEESRDARDRELVARLGLAAAAEQHAADLLDADPIECIRFATRDGEDIGLVSWLDLPDGRAYVLFVGVAVEHRGRGLGGELVAAATRELVAAGATTLIADTDDDNIGMVRGFARAGWLATASRIDLTLAARTG